jgi:hypothetical protein
LADLEQTGDCSSVRRAAARLPRSNSRLSDLGSKSASINGNRTQWLVASLISNEREITAFLAKDLMCVLEEAG